ncbi:PLDc_N domain-containing protein [Tuanshanicoccus lijuaniae]|uniref:PLD nuclease N-terminal domain-containing protein n=1 Tax=Aerococcaceae bacterium zg-1292 TaxID=2774330 RepID=UPI0019363EFE|nr:PLDc_N domain-containing protein [Aerococcaceae bacterium zg-1292]QQA38170.1 PLDc_N domain-containing protein [Aerococcaceae bacterium zg-1292]
MESIKEFLPVIIPIVILELGLMIYALSHVLKHERYKFGNRALWILIVVLVQIIGPILYLTVGKEND